MRAEHPRRGSGERATTSAELRAQLAALGYATKD
jgi:hypothetical protein